jgi:hypothetical protein
MKTKKKWLIIIVAIFLIAQIVYKSVYTINPDEIIILTRFGKVEKGPIKKPGYHFKLFIDQVVRYPSKEVMINMELPGCPPRIPVYYATMSLVIVDPIKFYLAINNIEFLPVRISYLLNERYCNKKSDVINDVSIVSISSFVDTELTKYGVSITNIDFSG